MFLLTGTSDLIQVVTSAAGAIDVHASFVDLSAGTQTPTRTNTAQITTAATTTVVGSPAGSTQRNVKKLVCRNASATITNQVTVKHTDGTNAETIVGPYLAPGDSLIWTDVSGWQFFPATTSIQVPGRLLQTTIKTTGTTFTTGANTNNIRLRMVGGGGGGGGCSSVAAAAAASGGGGAGGYCEKLVAVAPNTAYTYAIGAAGTGTSGAGGGNGGDTTFAVGATTYTAKGGTGAALGTATTTLTADAGGAGGVVGTNGDINASGAAGEYGVVLLVATPIVASGSGGSCLYGEGGIGLTAVGAGTAGTGNGSGGGGGATGASAARAGGAGTVGLIQVDEYA